MFKQVEFCPQCKCFQSMHPSLGLMAVNTPKGMKDVLLYHYHCETCNKYLRSTTLDHKDITVSPSLQESLAH